MSNCGTCKSWGLPHEIEKAEAFRSCVRVPHDKSMPGLTVSVEDVAAGTWPFDEDREAYMDERARTLAVVVDAEMYHAALRTSEAFGCVLHELPEEKASE